MNFPTDTLLPIRHLTSDALEDENPDPKTVTVFPPVNGTSEGSKEVNWGTG
jgi:hypothetical protein